jgi:protein SCO1/2
MAPESSSRRHAVGGRARARLGRWPGAPLRCAVALAVLGAAAASAVAHPDEATPAGNPGSPGNPPVGAPGHVPSGDDIAPAGPMYKAGGVTVDERLGARLPVEVAFRDQDGRRVTLGEVLHGELPTILTFNYSDCPMLCSLQLSGLTTALPPLLTPAKIEGDPSGKDAVFALGTQFRIVTIDLEPNEPIEKMAKMKERYIGRLPEAQRATARAGWTFLVAERPGDGAGIAKVAGAVGFRYTYVADRAEWAHPAALIFVSNTGVVTRYVYGIEFPADVMRASIFKAGLSEPATAVGFMNRCYHYDPEANSHAKAGVMALRLGSIAFLVLFLAVLGVMHLLKRQRRPGVIRP